MHLNPTDRCQKKQFRPTAREARVLRGRLDKWKMAGLDACHDVIRKH